jgi:hypothetical protein
MIAYGTAFPLGRRKRRETPAARLHQQGPEIVVTNIRSQQ